MNAQSKWAMEALAHLDASWRRLMNAIERLGPAGLQRQIRDGWTVKEMLAHLAFWEETSLPVTEWMHRGGSEVPVETWYGGVDLELEPEKPWPDQDTHNAREARWARSRADALVLERLHKARQQLMAIVVSVNEEESNGEIGRHLEGIYRHTDHHITEIEAMAIR